MGLQAAAISCRSQQPPLAFNESARSRDYLQEPAAFPCFQGVCMLPQLAAGVTSLPLRLKSLQGAKISCRSQQLALAFSGSASGLQLAAGASSFPFAFNESASKCD